MPTLNATLRTGSGKGVARKLRAAGKVPAVVYGATGEGASKSAMPIAVEPKALLKILHSESGANTLISAGASMASRITSRIVSRAPRACRSAAPSTEATSSERFVTPAVADVDFEPGVPLTFEVAEDEITPSAVTKSRIPVDEPIFSGTAEFETL